MTGTVLDFGLLMILKSVGMNTLIAISLSFIVGTINNFSFNRTWTFKGGHKPALQRQLIQFTAVSVIGLLLNSILILALEASLGNWLNQPELGYLPAKVIATGLVLFWNYFANKLWTFRSASRM
jgi:putative flippase GtrA